MSIIFSKFNVEISIFSQIYFKTYFFFQSILSEGGLYAFQLRATEILENGVTFGEQAITNVTLVITDQNDMLPTFNRYITKIP